MLKISFHQAKYIFSYFPIAHGEKQISTASLSINSYSHKLIFSRSTLWKKIAFEKASTGRQNQILDSCVADVMIPHAGNQCYLESRALSQQSESSCVSLGLPRLFPPLLFVVTWFLPSRNTLSLHRCTGISTIIPDTSKGPSIPLECK